MTATHPMQQTFDELRRRRNTDPATSHAAARQSHGLASAHRAAIMRVLRTVAERRVALAPHEIGARCGLTSVQVSRRLKELEDDGLIVEAGVAETPSGRQARTWRAF